MEKLEKLKKLLNNEFIPEKVKNTIRAEIKKLESEIKTDETMTATEVKEEVKEIEEKVEKALEVAEEKEEQAEAKAEEKKEKANNKEVKKTAMSIAKTIRKDGENWNDTVKRANSIMKDEKIKAEKTTKSELDKLLEKVRRNKKLINQLEGVKDLGRDAVRHAKPKGKRVSENGNVYYEYRPNKTDSTSFGKYSFADGGNFDIPFNVVYNTKSGRSMVASRIMARTPEEAKSKLEQQMRKSDSFDKVVFVHESFANGGEVVQDLAGHNDGVFGLGNHGLLDGYSGTHYSGLVGETNAMSSGEMFERGGKILNQYKDKTAKEIWNLWTLKQRQHFLLDHFNNFDVDDFKGKNLIEISNMDYKEIPYLVRKELEYHVGVGQYAKGGYMNDRNHVNKDEDYEVYYAKNRPYRKGYLGKREFADGGMLGKEIVFVRHGERGKGTIGFINDDGSYAVDTGHSVKLVEPNDIVEVKESKKRMWFFEGGGKIKETDRYSILGEVNGQQPILYSTTNDKNEIRNLVKMAEIDFNELTDKKHRIFVTDENIDDEIFNYEQGGTTDNYVPKKDLNTVTIKKGNKKLTYKISDVLNGAYKLESGAKIEDIAFYVPKRNIVKVQLKSGKDFKPTNGYWIKDTAKPIHVTKFDDGGAIPNNYKGKTAEEVWNLWTLKQREHFLADHYDVLSGQDLNSKNKDFDELQFITQAQLDLHIKQGQYDNGGNISEFKIGDVVANKRSKNIGIIRDVFDKGEVRTDADGVVDVSELVLYNKSKHINYNIAPSTKKEIKSKYDDGGKLEDMFLVKKNGETIAEFKTLEEAKDFIYEYELEHRVNLELIDPNYIPKYSKKYDRQNDLSEAEWLMKHNSSPEARIYEGGGKTTFKEKATAIAKNFEGKRVEPRYQKEYGKRYDKDEAKEVGNKITGSQKAKYDSKMSGGGSTQKGKGNHKMKEVTELAKKIRKDGEKWTDALKRAYSQMK